MFYMNFGQGYYLVLAEKPNYFKKDNLAIQITWASAAEEMGSILTYKINFT
jgi:hypothetical protein